MRLARRRLPSVPVAAVLAALLATLLLGPLSLSPARASQYPLEQARAIIPHENVARLRHAGVRTTADFLVWGRTPEGRKLLADRAGLTVEKITAWVCLADVMQVRGIGPDVARLFAAVGLKTLADLKRADPVATAVAVHDLNKKAHLSTNPPGAESIRYWVDQSQALPILVLLE